MTFLCAARYCTDEWRIHGVGNAVARGDERSITKTKNAVMRVLRNGRRPIEKNLIKLRRNGNNAIIGAPLRSRTRNMPACAELGNTPQAAPIRSQTSRLFLKCRGAVVPTAANGSAQNAMWITSFPLAKAAPMAAEICN